MSLDLPTGYLSGITGLHFLRPQWLWLLLALPLLGWWRRRNRIRQSVWRDVVDPHLLPHLLQHRRGVGGHRGLWLGLLGAALGVCALAGPSWQRVEQPLWQNRAPLVIALDLSRASTASDLPPSRLLQARAKISTLLQQRAGGQVGLVAFADDAYTVAPLTDDAGNIALFLDALTPEIMPGDGEPSTGSHAERAIDWSGQLLRQAGFERGDIVLLTDHADSAARDAAAVSASAGYRVSVLGLGTTQGAAYRDADGRIARAQLDADSLRALATAGQGAYAALTPGVADLAALGVLDPQRTDTVAAHGEKTRVWTDQGYWLLLPMLLLAAFAFRRGGALAALLLCLWLPSTAVHAAGNNWWQRPDQQRHQQMLRGAEAYRGQDYAAADQAWHNLPGADAAYNRGNALARQAQYDAAIAQYDQALRMQPGMADAIANKKAVEAAKRRKPPAGQQQADNKQNKNQQDKGQQNKNGQGNSAKDNSGQNQNQAGNDQQGKSGQPSSQRAPQPQPARSPADRQQQPASQSAGGDKAQAGQPLDAESQRKADAAQRTRMQQALRNAQQDKSGHQMQASASKADETPAQREQRIANEAWLQRVPDDPGGLLRARFRLEAERRQQEGR